MKEQSAVIERLENGDTAAEEMFLRGPIGRMQLELLLDCIAQDRCALAARLFDLLKARLVQCGSGDWQIEPGVFERRLNEQMLQAFGRRERLYRYCLVHLDGIAGEYSYLTEDLSLRCGDAVLVPFGPENTVQLGTLVQVRDHTESSAPYPPEKTKYILRAAGRPTIPGQGEKYETGDR